eukprot:Nitzschia sp. Nitz4//scaffold6_size259037//92749//94444//NITZ4_001064-RA/size259037-augustus-gene-0.289-mRNA-1//1//CDS//3329556863//5149//frame0
MFFTCELSGESLTTTQEEIVATPSGHLCLKRLLLTKLAENGGVDPFEPPRPLSQDQLITIQPFTGSSASGSAIPRPPQATSLPNLLHCIQSEYDALVLELFDTRKALEETRKELSQALYQNDAAVRVVARLSMERDAARQELERWDASRGPAPSNTADAGADAEQPPAKRVKTSLTRLSNDLPEAVLQAMTDTWQSLHANRKGLLKALAAKAVAPTADWKSLSTSTWHGDSPVICLASNQDLVATASNQQLVLSSASTKEVQQTIPLDATPVSLHVRPNDENASTNSWVLALNDGRLWVNKDGSLTKHDALPDTPWLQAQLHPTNNHVCGITADGRVLVRSLEDASSLSEFRPPTPAVYTCGAIHPDGLLYAAGTATGEVHLWDFKSKTLASRLQESASEEDAVTCIAFSNNGYHLATGHKSAAVRFWDLRKQKTMATMNADQSILTSVDSVAYDPSGKFVTMGGQGGVVVTTVKEWGTTAKIVPDNANAGISNVAWVGAGLVCTQVAISQVSWLGQSS